MKLDKLRRVTFRPYRKGMGPTFTLTIWESDKPDRRNNGRNNLAYRLTMRDPSLPGHTGKASIDNPAATILFEGEDFGCSPRHASDSDASVASLMSILTLRPGDTDSEYFANYREAQLDYCDQHAEALACSVYDRFGEE